jgi:Phosphomethylpyrimidine kinase
VSLSAFSLAASIKPSSSLASQLSTLTAQSSALSSALPTTAWMSRTHYQVHQPPQLLKPTVVYTLACSDYDGGVDLQADVHAVHTLGGHACTIITCLTAQNSVGVTKVKAVAINMICSQWECLCSNMMSAAVKTDACERTQGCRDYRRPARPCYRNAINHLVNIIVSNSVN